MFLFMINGHVSHWEVKRWEKSKLKPSSLHSVSLNDKWHCFNWGRMKDFTFALKQRNSQCSLLLIIDLSNKVGVNGWVQATITLRKYYFFLFWKTYFVLLRKSLMLLSTEEKKFNIWKLKVLIIFLFFHIKF